MEITFLKPEWLEKVEPKETSVLVNKANEILNDSGSNKIDPKTIIVVSLDDNEIEVDYEGKDSNNNRYGQTVCFFRKKNMQFIYC